MFERKSNNSLGLFFKLLLIVVEAFALGGLILFAIDLPEKIEFEKAYVEQVELLETSEASETTSPIVTEWQEYINYELAFSIRHPAILSPPNQPDAEY
jgi:hypothetical protein